MFELVMSYVDGLQGGEMHEQSLKAAPAPLVYVIAAEVEVPNGGGKGGELCC